MEAFTFTVTSIIVKNLQVFVPSPPWFYMICVYYFTSWLDMDTGSDRHKQL